jgi:hypothetical protein
MTLAFIDTIAEPHLTLNEQLNPIVAELKKLEVGFQVEGHEFKVVLFNLACDDPGKNLRWVNKFLIVTLIRNLFWQVALRKCLGLLGHATKQGCPYCTFSSKRLKGIQSYAGLPPFTARERVQSEESMFYYFFAYHGQDLSDYQELRLARQLGNRFSCIVHLNFNMVGSAPVDVLHVLMLGLVQQELKLYAAQLSEVEYQAFASRWYENTKLPVLSENKSKMFRSTITGKQLVSQTWKFCFVMM